jgi:hypothetical protein
MKLTTSRLLSLLAACLVIAALAFSALPGKTVSAQSASKIFRPSADAYVLQSSPTTNYGTKTNLRVDSSPITRSYLRFTISGLNGAPVQSAKLRIFANSSASGVIANALANNSWTESGLTYANAPAPGSAINTSAACSSGQWVSVDVTSYLKGEGTYNLVITSTSATNASLGARESGANAPQLVITTGSSAPTATRPAATATNPVATATKPAPTATKPAPTATQPAPTATAPSGDWQPTFPIRAAFYYPWFPEAWTQQGIYPYTNYTPTLGYYSSADQAILKKHIDMMEYGNIQAGIASWWGQGTHTDTKISGLLSAAAGTRFRWALYYESESQGDPSASQIQADLIYIRDHYGKDPSFLRVNGKFVVFVYAASNDTCGMVSRWKQANTVGAYVVLKVFPGYASCSGQPDSWHQYAPAVAADQQGSFSYAISPGFWLKGQSVRLARDLNRWTQNVKDMAASRANWQLVTTFSEWGEGTIVEPATQWASPSGYGKYLDALHTYGTQP